MKLYKSTMGLGLLALMFSACDKAAEQDYTPAAPVATPPAYFSMDYDGSVIIDENQTSFSVPVYRANTSGEETVNIDCKVNGDFFSYKLANGQTVAFQAQNGQGSAAIPVTFPAGEGSAVIEIVYPWETMAANAGTEYKFDFTTQGAPSEYFITQAEYIALYVPWQAVVGPKGETSATWKDDALYSGFNVTGADPVWEVDIQGNPLKPGMYRILNPYAGAPQNSTGDDFQYHGTGDIYMYINATDPENVYLSDKLGNPLPNFNTYYTLSADYSDISLFDRAAGTILNETLDGESNAGYGLGTRTDFVSGGVTYVDYIEFAPDHFYVYTDGYTTGSDGSLVIIFPGGQGKREWNDLGMCSYSDAMISVANGMDPVTYEVPVQQNVDNPYLYRMVNPYTNYWVEPNPQDEDFDIQIDCSDAEFVLVKPADTGNWMELDGEFLAAYMTNAGYYYTTVVSEQYRKTKAQLIAAGQNDTFVNGVINMPNAMALAVDSEGYSVGGFDCAVEGTPGCKLVLTSPAAAPANYVTAAAVNPAKGLDYRKNKSGKMKAVKLFDMNRK